MEEFYYNVTTNAEEMKQFVSSTVSYLSSSTIINIAAAPASQKAQLRLYDYLIPSLGSVIIALNLAVVISSGLILKKGQQPRSTYLFMGNVAMTDLITGIAVVFGQLYPKEYRNQPICAIQIGMIVSSTLASVYSVGLIAIDRFLYILHGLQYQRWVYPMRARMLIITSWFIGLLVGFMPLFGWAGDTDNGRVCWFIVLAPKNLIMLTIIMGAIPLITVVVLYTIILYHAIKKIVHLQRSADEEAQRKPPDNPSGLRMFRGAATAPSVNSDDEGREASKPSLFKRVFTRRENNNVNAPSKWKAIKVVMFTSGSFVISWGPYFVASLIYAYCEDQNSPRCKNLAILIASPLAILGFANSLANPIIYAWWHKGFRSFVSKRWNSARGRKKASITPSSKETSSRKISSSSTDTLQVQP